MLVGAERLRPAKQPSSMQVEVGQREADDQAVRVLCDPAIADFSEAEDALDDVRGVLDASSDTCLRAVNRTLALGESFLASRVPVRKIGRRGSARPSRCRLTAIAGVAPYARLFTVQELR